MQLVGQLGTCLGWISKISKIRYSQQNSKYEGKAGVDCRNFVVIYTHYEHMLRVLNIKTVTSDLCSLCFKKISAFSKI